MIYLLVEEIYVPETLQVDRGTNCPVSSEIDLKKGRGKMKKNCGF